ncbi:PREDICTED: protein RETICULATA-RELATED 1, chloroplastic [Tarenaya hassleriana]|uniref:protein RETICULATA-RELATED 1, chloroplastic n=1 Tax=Tarenaya hassleriana TaxID=28532 RepID=UPI00053C3036|nr:PREDICTED: protein RETICULATA-RELATED 1, chloroplastic [Tarenaya hassleriana]XP_010535647.1 PREDICTED: protein RETICULATA-RELATED 1, chloroplastic [Tarenaya hassleriana]XP_010535649.1 PREDICTED: protein RETICULATA-RELATED 1, chloroplastic [Tarenaya hassleriana]XP_010535650.1 PREDICTED: protein RETICULATA-RELATED 1, chloroplastic [Tarenaya hassleriana]XP_010535651.1 PREDICTED: protein RETICULATA-RELATED 1, chloroplastic [Tarenaya hassleriana]XP_019057837.1 PREDICTED: protein RETICULATA-RELAT
MSITLKISSISSFSDDGFNGLDPAKQCCLIPVFEIGSIRFPGSSRSESARIRLLSAQPSRQLKTRCVGLDAAIPGEKSSRSVPEWVYSGVKDESAGVLEPETGGGDGGAGNQNSGGGGGWNSGDDGDGGDGEDEADKAEEKEFGPILKLEEVMRETEGRGVTLPVDMLEAAKSVGIRKLFLLRYLDLQGSVWPLGFLMRNCSMLRNRMLADPSFLFKVGTEIAIDSCCATFAEVQKRGEDFWSEFELYAADLLVGIVVDIALVGLLAPYARIGKPSVASKGLFRDLQRASAALPSSVFEAERPGCKFTVQQRIATYFYKGILYGSVGFGCGLIGQGIANLIMTAKRSIKKSEEDIPVPPLFQSAALWGFFLAVSSNTRYQIINGLERVVEASAVAKRVPAVALAFTVGVRFANNIYGGMQFVDWAKMSGVQ